jgi:hypothetical protein
MLRFHAERAAQQILRGQPLQERCRRCFEIDCIRQMNEKVGWHDTLLGIRTERLDIGDPIAGGEVGDVLAYCNDLTGAFLPLCEGQVEPRKGAGSKIDIYEVHADRAVPDADLAGPWRSDRNIVVAWHVWSAMLVNPNGLHQLFPYRLSSASGEASCRSDPKLAGPWRSFLFSPAEPYCFERQGGPGARRRRVWSQRSRTLPHSRVCRTGIPQATRQV